MMGPLAAEETIDAISRVLVNRNLYGASHPIAKRTTNQAWEKLNALLQSKGNLSIGLAEGELLLQDQLIERPRATSRLLMERLQQHHVNGIEFTSACTAAGLETLCALLGEQPDNTVSIIEQLSAAGTRGILIEKSVYKRVSEDSKPVSGGIPREDHPETDSDLIDFFSRFQSESPPEEREAPDTSEPRHPPGQGDGQPGERPADSEALKPAERKETSSATTEDMAAFLDGKTSPPMREVAKKAASGKEKDISAMVTLFIATMLMRRNTEKPDPQSFADSFLSALKNTYKAVTDSASRGSAHTPGAIREMNSRLSEWFSSPEARMLPEATAGIAENIAEEAIAEAEIGMAYASYTSSRKKFLRSEAQWKAVILQYGPEKLLAMGLSPSSEVGAPAADATTQTPQPAVPVSASQPAVSVEPPQDLALQAMLSALRFSADDGGSSVDYLKEIDKLRDEIDKLIESTTQKIDTLLEKTEKLKSPEPEAPPPNPGELLEMLSEAVQELLQPLSVVNCSLDILSSPNYRNLGEENRRNTVMLALENSRRIQKLIEKLGTVSGLPKDLAPRPEIL